MCNAITYLSTVGSSTPAGKSDETMPALNLSPNDKKYFNYKMKKRAYTTASEVYLLPCMASLQKSRLLLNRVVGGHSLFRHFFPAGVQELISEKVFRIFGWLTL
jgi:hypothetical protein